MGDQRYGGLQNLEVMGKHEEVSGFEKERWAELEKRCNGINQVFSFKR